MKKLTQQENFCNLIKDSKARNYLVSFLIFLICVTFVSNQVNADIVGVSSTSVSQNLIRVYSDVTWTVISSNSMSLAGFTLVGAQAVTWNSDDLKFYAIVQTDIPTRRLVTIDPATGVCTDIGEIGTFSSLTYSSTNSTLYAMGARGGGAIAERLYSVDLTTAATTFLGGPYPVGADGEVIAYNYDDGFIYHWSGNVTANMEKINTSTFAATPVAQTGFVHGEIFGAVYMGGGKFVATDINARAVEITSAGVVTLQLNSIPLFPPRGLGFIDPLLPVELASFTSAVSGNDVSLIWTTASESNNSGFDIERNANGQWSKIGNVSGSGTSTISNSYSFTDRNLSSGNYSYRLKQIDFNGNFEYFNLSNEVNIGVPVQFELAQNYPNPFNPSTTINFNLPLDGKVSIVLFDMSGREVSTLVNDFKTAGFYSVNFNASALSSGVYYYTINFNGFTATKKMMLIK